MFDSDTGMSFLGSSAVDNATKVMNEPMQGSSNRSSNNDYNRPARRERYEYEPPKPIEFKEVVEIRYHPKDNDVIQQLRGNLSNKNNYKTHMTIFQEGIMGSYTYAGLRFNADTPETLNEIIATFKLEFNKIKTARILNKEYKYKSLEITENENMINATLIVPPFSKARDVPVVVANTLNMNLNISVEKDGLFSEKVINFQAKGDAATLNCFKEIFQTYLVKEYSSNTKTNKKKM